MGAWMEGCRRIGKRLSVMLSACCMQLWAGKLCWGQLKKILSLPLG